MTKTIKVGITVGDTNGVGIEIILKFLQKKEWLEFFTPIIFGSTKILNFHAQKLGFEKLAFHGIKTPKEAIGRKINVVNIWQDLPEIVFGKPTETSGKLAFESLQAATNSLKENGIDVLVTAPINKKNIQSDVFKFPGHTEYLENELEGKSLMFMVSENLRVSIVTQHIPLEKVKQEITQELIVSKAKLMIESLEKDFYIRKPKIAILGLNPHAGDDGLIGEEEEKIIIPAINTLKKAKILAYGPYASDSFFVPKNLKNFDGVLAMYHDQGLIPFKTLTFEEGVNFTAGLNNIRTSPDHGVAYDIAGKGKASINSFKEAIFTAIEIYKNRANHAEDTKNPLKKQGKKVYAQVDEDLPNT